MHKDKNKIKLRINKSSFLALPLHTIALYKVSYMF